jgi:molecular chaperone GrpE
MNNNTEQNQTPPAVPVSEPASVPETAKTVTLTEADHAQLKADAAKAVENWDKFLRAAADFDNYRKRVTREKEELTRASRETIITALLPSLDNLERALEHSPEGTPLHDGLLQVQKQFERALTDFGLLEIIAAPGSPFDPNLHEAISHIESKDQPEGAILQQIQSGYKLADRLLRPARVVVSKGAPGTDGATPSTPPAEKKNSWFNKSK